MGATRALHEAVWNRLLKLKRLLGFFSPTIDRDALAATYLSGDGIEIGALHSPLQVPDAARVRYLDRLPVAELRRQYPELASRPLARVDIVDDGELLGKVADQSQDFVIANHFVEHCQNPLLAVGNMFRVLKPGGVLYLALPDRRRTFDAARPATTLEHLERDYREGPAWSKRAHYLEWARLVGKIEDPAAVEREADRQMERDYSIHFHVWDQKEMIELVLFLQGWYSFELEALLKRHEENIVVLRKCAGGPANADSSARASRPPASAGGAA